MNPPEAPRRWRNRITRYEACVDPADLVANPQNFRIHPERQSQAMRAALDEIGWIDAVIVVEGSDIVVDGHLRAADAITAEECVPVLYVDLDETETANALATFDAITGLAVIDSDKLTGLVADTTIVSPVLASVVTDLLPSGHGANGEEPDEPDNPVVWGYVSWGKNRRIDSSEPEVTALDAAYELFCARNDGSDLGFIGALIGAWRDTTAATEATAG